MSVGDIRKVKQLAVRLGARDSDVIRFAVKSTLARLGPLYDAEARGRNLVPVFVEWGSELLRFFDLDASRLEAVINEGAEPLQRVDRDDLALLALAASQEPYAVLKLCALDPSEEHRGQSSAQLSESLRRYLYSKYVYSSEGAAGFHERSEQPRMAVNGMEHQKVAEG